MIKGAIITFLLLYYPIVKAWIYLEEVKGFPISDTLQTVLFITVVVCAFYFIFKDPEALLSWIKKLRFE